MGKPTKEHIVNSMIKLIPLRGIDNVTVTELVKECNISRQTFYYHFRSIDEVLENIIIFIVNEALDESTKSTDLYDIIYMFLKKCQQYDTHIEYLKKSNQRGKLSAFLMNSLRTSLLTSFNVLSSFRELSDELKLKYVNFYSYAIIGFLYESKSMTDEFVTSTSDFLHYSIQNTLGNKKTDD